MIRKSHNALLAGLMLALLALPAMADQEVNETVKARSNGTVAIENIAGAIEVVGWDRDEVKVEGTLTGEAEEVVINAGETTRIKVKYPEHARNLEGGATLVIHVPSASRVEVECISAGIDVHGVTGTIDAESISGEVTVAGKCKSVEAQSISGDVTIDCEADKVEVSSVSGRVKASGRTSDASAETVSGGISLAFDKVKELKVESVAGDVTVAGDFAAGGDFGFELHSGTLQLTVPAKFSASFQVETFSGDIENEFGQQASRTSKYAPGSRLEFTNGGGEARVRIDTFSGDVVIRKK